jgi:hypothetical protein
VSYSRNVVRSRFFGQPNLSMMIFQFLAYLSQKAIVQGFKTEKTLRLENGVPNPNIFQERSFPSCSVFHLFFFYKGWEKPKSPKQKSERPSVRASRGVGCSGWSTSCSWKSSLWAPVPWPTSSPFGNVPWTRLLHAVAQFLWIERGWIWLRIRYC